MNGFEFLSIVRKRFPHIPVIAISGEFSGMGVPSSVLADAFFPKGQYTLEDLFKKIIALLKQGKLRSDAMHLPKAAVWLPVGREVNFLAVTCSHCLRTFSVSTPRPQGTNVANCDFCVTPVSFEVPGEPLGRAAQP
jgi:hypothetical protein